MCCIFRTVRPKNFKVGVWMEDVDPHQRQAPWPLRSKVKVISSHRLYVSSLPLIQETKCCACVIRSGWGHTVSAEPGGHTSCCKWIHCKLNLCHDAPHMQCQMPSYLAEIIESVSTMTMHCLSVLLKHPFPPHGRIWDVMSAWRKLNTNRTVFVLQYWTAL